MSKPMKGKRYVLLKGNRSIGIYERGKGQLTYGQANKKKGVSQIEQWQKQTYSPITLELAPWVEVFSYFAHTTNSTFQQVEILDVTDTISECLETVLELEGCDNLKLVISELITRYYL